MKIVAANFKSNKTRLETLSYLRMLDFRLSFPNNVQNASCAKNAKNLIYIFPSISSLAYDCFTNFRLGVQNAYPAVSGSYTGEMTLYQILEFDINTIMIGHVERQMFHESNEFLKMKFDFYKERGFTIFYCLHCERDNLDSLRDQVCNIDLNYKNLILVYEPISSIGTGKPAKIDDIQRVINYLKDMANVRVIYGGSVNCKNYEEILESCDGVMVGNASLNLEEFINIAR